MNHCSGGRRALSESSDGGVGKLLCVSSLLSRVSSPLSARVLAFFVFLEGDHE